MEPKAPSQKDILPLLHAFDSERKFATLEETSQLVPCDEYFSTMQRRWCHEYLCNSALEFCNTIQEYNSVVQLCNTSLQFFITIL